MTACEAHIPVGHACTARLRRDTTEGVRRRCPGRSGDAIAPNEANLGRRGGCDWGLAMANWGLEEVRCGGRRRVRTNEANPGNRGGCDWGSGIADWGFEEARPWNGKRTQFVRAVEGPRKTATRYDERSQFHNGQSRSGNGDWGFQMAHEGFAGGAKGGAGNVKRSQFGPGDAGRRRLRGHRETRNTCNARRLGMMRCVLCDPVVTRGAVGEGNGVRGRYRAEIAEIGRKFG